MNNIFKRNQLTKTATAVLYLCCFPQDMKADVDMQMHLHTINTEDRKKIFRLRIIAWVVAMYVYS